jgi:hypothetical protein
MVPHLPLFLRVAFAPSFPSAVRVCFGKWAIVFRFFAAAAAFLIFAFAAVRCFSVAMRMGLVVWIRFDLSHILWWLRVGATLPTRIS